MSDNANNDPIAAAMNMTPMIPGDQPGQIMKLMGDALDDSAKKDFTTARANILNLIDTGTESFDKLVQIATASQHPRAFEVVSTLMKTLVDANKDLLEIQSKIREIDNSDTPQNGEARVINNNLFVGSTHELQKMLKSMGKNDTARDLSGKPEPQEG
jgi:Terminase DNA packaging enzyme